MSASASRPVRRETRLEIAFLEGIRSRCPSHEPTLEALAHLYTRVGRIEEGLALDEELTRRHPDDPEQWYNLACSLALLQRTEEAFATLERALRLGYRDAEWMRHDRDLASLHDDPRFRQLLARAQTA